MYVILFFSIIVAYWRWSFRQNSWIKTEHGKNVCLGRIIFKS